MKGRIHRYCVGKAPVPRHCAARRQRPGPARLAQLAHQIGKEKRRHGQPILSENTKMSEKSDRRTGVNESADNSAHSGLQMAPTRAFRCSREIERAPSREGV